MPNGGVRSEKHNRRKRPDNPKMMLRLQRGAAKMKAKAERAATPTRKWF
jgi:hypothetical protein